MTKKPKPKPKSKSKPTTKPTSSVRRPSYPQTRAPRPAPLLGMEDHAIAPLEALARDYADIRDERADLTKREAALKTRRRPADVSRQRRLLGRRNRRDAATSAPVRIRE
jgi:hypothetical protein